MVNSVLLHKAFLDSTNLISYVAIDFDRYGNEIEKDNNRRVRVPLISFLEHIQAR